MAPCFLCGTPMTSKFSARDHLRTQVATEYQVEWCEGCAFGQVAGSFTPAEVSAFYTEGYYTHVGAHMGDDASTDGRKSFLERLRTHLAWRTDRSVDLSPAEVARVRANPTLCDVGCGSGQIMARFKEAGYETVGVEPDPAARVLAAEVGPVFKGTAEELPEALDGSRFDVVLLSHVLEHCIDPAAALANVVRLLAPTGTAVIEVPNNAAEGLRLYGPGWFFADIPRHLQFFTETSLRKALAAAGLHVTNVFYTGYTRQFAPEWLAAQREIGSRVAPNGSAEGRSGGNWGLLAKTAFAAPAAKYDSIRVHAVHAG
jgi:SAM-dependent methyltransferase